MKTDAELQKVVMDEIKSEPSVTAAWNAPGVDTVKNDINVALV